MLIIQTGLDDLKNNEAEFGQHKTFLHDYDTEKRNIKQNKLIFQLCDVLPFGVFQSNIH